MKFDYETYIEPCSACSTHACLQLRVRDVHDRGIAAVGICKCIAQWVKEQSTEGLFHCPPAAQRLAVTAASLGLVRAPHIHQIPVNQSKSNYYRGSSRLPTNQFLVEQSITPNQDNCIMQSYVWNCKASEAYGVRWFSSGGMGPTRSIVSGVYWNKATSSVFGMGTNVDLWPWIMFV